MVIARDGFFYHILTQIMDFFSCSPLNTSFLYLKNMKKALKKNPEYVRCDIHGDIHGDIIITLQ